MLAITILSCIGMLVSFIGHARQNKIDMNLLFPAILSISLWETHQNTAIAVIIFTGFVMFINFITRD